MDRKELESYIFDTYSSSPDYPWARDSETAVFRHSDNRKWFALLMELPGEKLDSRLPGKVWVLNLKCDPKIIGSMRMEPGFYGAYHMNRNHWISAVLGVARDEDIKWLLELSYTLTGRKKPRRQAADMI